MNRETRARLLSVLAERYTWVSDPAWGPRAVEAGECDGCGAEARLVTTCGPGPAVFLGRVCASSAGADAWCSGHAEEAEAALTWLTHLPAEADTVARLYWVATGEVALAPHLVRRDLQTLRLPAH